ncbi:DNRLRE domain-containing protein [Patescibacteria group bacterium]|nr:DNRLRE domain-containing protein [Patescibacteria group bacterium]
MKTKHQMRQVATFALGLFFFASPLFASAATTAVKPGPFPDGMSTWYGSVYNTSSQHDDKLQVGGWGDEYDSLVRFNLSALPVTATQAVVWLYAYPRGDASTPVNIEWYRNTTQWHTGSVSWSTKPSGNDLGYTNAPTTIPGWYGVDFTSLYNSWRSGSSPNYGLALKPLANNNRFDMFRGSGYTADTTLRPELDVTYNTSGTDSIPHFKWPLSSVAYASRSVTQAFGAFPWAGGTECPVGYQKYHNGTDYSTGGVGGATEYAPEDGIVKEVTFDSSGWGYNVVMEHVTPGGGSTYTSVIWHISPNSDVTASNPGGFIPKGAPLGTVASLTYPKVSHFHFGIRRAAYSYPTSGAGALPQSTCSSYLGYPASFVDPESSSNVIFN